MSGRLGRTIAAATLCLAASQTLAAEKKSGVLPPARPAAQEQSKAMSGFLAQVKQSAVHDNRCGEKKPPLKDKKKCPPLSPF